jgi:hypothetical protein
MGIFQDKLKQNRQLNEKPLVSQTEISSGIFYSKNDIQYIPGFGFGRLNKEDLENMEPGALIRFEKVKNG